jgi:colicin import membrane protein
VPKPPKTDDFGPSKPKAVTPDAQIAEKAKREKEQREEQERLEKQRQQEAAKKAEEEAAKKKAQEEAAKKKAQQEAARKKREEEEKRLAEQIAKAEAADRARQAAATARQMEIQSWVDKIKAKILNRAIVPDTVPTGTEVAVRIRILPGGDVLDISVTRSSSPTYSAAIERAIRSAAPLPVPPANSDLFPEFRDLNLNFRHER